MTDLDPASNEILNVIRCKCKPSSKCHFITNACSCRKHGLSCVAACQECRGCDCTNSVKLIEESDSNDDWVGGGGGYLDKNIT